VASSKILDLDDAIILILAASKDNRIGSNPFRPIHYTGVVDFVVQNTICKIIRVKTPNRKLWIIFTSPSVLELGSMKIVINYTNQNLKKF
jgi:hypothetical protein